MNRIPSPSQHCNPLSERFTANVRPIISLIEHEYATLQKRKAAGDDVDVSIVQHLRMAHIDFARLAECCE
ncbi:hypothetical protein W02_38340 [Nitrospira sp. KM1]|uniref:hypothetical protein n=1 Tax=Nitrospira sp. KM1 TaxID=1936990 RepID=UPI0013A73AEB|nr:hypothetical protein [Nitrospira sp. KM1]BCA56694.1 hypothetical protein W02_38340 [Nitrospira sp. KM1]